MSRCRSLLAGSVCLATIALSNTSPYAADIPSAPAYKSPAAVVAFSWAGFYAGLNGGWGTCSNCTLSINGGFVGGQIGYNWQSGALVTGLEVDADYSWIGRTDTVLGVAIDERNKAFGTVRGRIGFAPDRALLYVTGGYAWSINEISATLLGVTLSATNTHSGYAAGAGVEYAIAPNWSVKAEYLYMGFGSKDYFGVPSGDLNIHTAKLGVNYLFGR